MQPNSLTRRFHPTYSVTALDEYGQARVVQVAEEVPLTLWVDGQVVVTLMTLGSYPEALALGYLRNQFWVKTWSEIKSVQVNWQEEKVRVATVQGSTAWEERMSQRQVMTTCGQGTILKNLDKLEEVKILSGPIQQSGIYAVLQSLNNYNTVYHQVGGVHGCALCRGTEILAFVEDVGRHNATDTIAGLMWLQQWSGEDKMFYTTGRLTAEMVMKVANMGIPVLLSRSSVTAMAIRVAEAVGMTLITSAKGSHFLIFNGDQRVVFDV